VDLKKIIAEKLQLEMDSFRVFRGPYQYKSELRNLEEPLYEQGIMNNNRVFIELGVPMKSGELNLRFVVFDPNTEVQVHELFTIPLSAKLTVAEAKVEIVRIFRERQLDEQTKFTGIPDWDIGNPENLRLRDINLNPVNPRNIYMDEDTVRTMSRNLMFTIPDIAIQKLPEGMAENKQSKATIIFFLQEFNNETYTLGKRFEFDTNDNESITSFRDRIAKTTNIAHIGLVGGDSWIGHNRLDIPHLKWNEPPACDENGTPVYTETSKVRSLNIQDGDLILYKDLSVIPMPLNDEEKKIIRDADFKRRGNLLSFSSGRKRMGNAREAKLVICQKDVALDDDGDTTDMKK